MSQITKVINEQKARELLNIVLPAAVSRALKTLLETKHLYQRVDVQVEKEAADAISRYALLHQTMTMELFGRWVAFGREPIKKEEANTVYFLLPTVRTYCSECGREQPFNPVGNMLTAPDFDSGFGLPTQERLKKYFSPGVVRVDVYVLTYECQGCKGIPQVFLVRREGTKLTLSGRTPIEHVEVPRVIPQTGKEFYSGALVAYQSGQHLAGLFMLRTCIEQVARNAVEGSETIVNGDELLKRYMEGLPEAAKGHFPSMRATYGTISTAIHAANPELAPFEDIRKDIDSHFEGVDVHKRAAARTRPQAGQAQAT